MPAPTPARLADGGPVYAETPADLTSYPGPAAEPWNAGTALLFVAVAAAWAWRLRGASARSRS